MQKDALIGFRISTLIFRLKGKKNNSSRIGMVFKLHGSVDWARLVERPYDDAGSDALIDSAEKFELAGAYVISILNCGDAMTEERKPAILFAATILAARKLNESRIKPWRAQGNTQ